MNENQEFELGRWLKENKGNLGKLALVALVVSFSLFTGVRLSNVENDMEQMVSPLVPYLPEEYQAKWDEMLAKWDEIEPTVISLEDWLDQLDVIEAQGVSNFDQLALLAKSTTPVLKVDQLSTGDIVQFKDNGTEVWSIDGSGDVAQTGASTLIGALTVGIDGTGHDVTFYSDTAGDWFLWDQANEALTIIGTAAQDALNVDEGNVDIADDVDIDGTTNLDEVDIDGVTQIDNTVTVGVAGTSFDVTFYSATAGDHMVWTAADEALTIIGTAAQDALNVDDGNVDFGADMDVDGTTNLDVVDIDDTLTVDAAGAVSLDAGAASNFNTVGAGIDLTLEAEAGRLVLKGDEPLADAVYIDADDAVGVGLTIATGATAGMVVDGGPVDIRTNILDGAGTLTFLDDALFDLQADASVSVQAIAAPTVASFVVEDDGGTDVLACKVAPTAIAGGFNLIDLIDTSPAMDGTDTVYGLNIALTEVASTGTGNHLAAVNLGLTTPDPLVSEVGLLVADADFDYAIDAGVVPVWSSAQTLFSDFLGDTIQAEHIGICGTDPQCVAPALVQEQYGVAELVSGDDGANCAADCSELAWGLHWQADQGSLVFEARLHIDTALTNAIVCVGLSDNAGLEMPATIAAGDAVTLVADDMVAFCFDDAADTDEWFLLGAAATTGATGNGATGVAPTFGVYQVLRIEVDAAGAAARGYIDGVLVGTLTANAVTITDPLTPVVVVDTNAAASVTIDVDYFGVSAQRQ